MGLTMAIAAGGALGALGRHWLTIGVHRLTGAGFPYGTVTVNIVGSFVMGALYVILVERLAMHAPWRAFLLVGVLGAFTTFSTFSMDTLHILEQGQMGKALVHVLATVLLCLAACALGLWVARSYA
jgi:CrcB protein